MATFQIPGTAMQGISSFGSRPPEAGFYAVSIVEVEKNPKDKPGKRRVHVQFENGFRMFDFLSLPFNDDGSAMSGLTDKQVRGQLAAFRTMLESLGYTGPEIEGGTITDDWLLAGVNGGRKGYVECVPGQQGVQGSYSTINRWMNRAQHESLKNSGNPTPTQNTAPAVNTPAQAAPASAPVANAAPPVNGGGTAAPVPGVALPPPPSAAQTIVS